MDRFFRRSSLRWAALAASLALAAPLVGCTKLLTTVVYLARGTDTPAESNDLKDKKVVVVCRPLTELTYGCSSAPNELAAEVGRQLKAHLKRKIKIVDPDDLADWTDEHGVDDYVEIGRNLEADMVLGIDMMSFNTLLGQTLLQGKAQVKVAVYDIKQDGEIVFQKSLPQVIFPENNGIPTQDKPEEEFRQQYIRVLADEIGRLFYSHDHFARYARNNSTMSD
ncbi:MAG TPA: hypothetical protein VMV10_10365 [Pirellulales bacterium]|nr:hypothetical protein [Pirellulales bacterium]